MNESSPVTVLHGVGPKRAEQLARLGIFTLREYCPLGRRATGRLCVGVPDRGDPHDHRTSPRQNDREPFHHVR